MYDLNACLRTSQFSPHEYDVKTIKFCDITPLHCKMKTRYCKLKHYDNLNDFYGNYSNFTMIIYSSL